MKLTKDGTKLKSGIQDVELESQLIRLPEEDFLRIVSIRLNIPLSATVVRERGIGEEHHEYFTEEYLVDELFSQLAATKEIITIRGGKTVTVRKYYNRALRLGKWIQIAKPTPIYIVNKSDLSPRILVELKSLASDSKYSYNYVMKQGVGRIFENIDSVGYHRNIASSLKVRLDD
jgi:hypothetical protein